MKPAAFVARCGAPDLSHCAWLPFVCKVGQLAIHMYGEPTEGGPLHRPGALLSVSQSVSQSFARRPPACLHCVQSAAISKIFTVDEA